MDWGSKIGDFLAQTGLDEKIFEIFEAGDTALAQSEKSGLAAIGAAERTSNDPIRAIGDSLNDRPWEDEEPRDPEFGDIIAISRGVYWHYAVYVGPKEVIHFTSLTSDVGDNEIMVTDFAHFLRDGDAFFVLDLDEDKTRKVKSENTTGLQAALISIAGVDFFGEFFGDFFDQLGMKLYSPEETVARARTQVGRADYDLLGNNCEHFAWWCKTGTSHSTQVERLLSLFFVPGRFKPRRRPLR